MKQKNISGETIIVILTLMFVLLSLIITLGLFKYDWVTIVSTGEKTNMPAVIGFFITILLVLIIIINIYGLLNKKYSIRMQEK